MPLKLFIISPNFEEVEGVWGAVCILFLLCLVIAPSLICHTAPCVQDISDCILARALMFGRLIRAEV